MFIQSSSVARRTQQYLSLLRHLNTSTGPRKIGLSLSENLQKYPLFSSENPRGFSGNDILPRAFVPLHLQCGFRFFSANPVQFCESQDDEFSKLDAMETNETESSAVKNSPQGKTIDLLFREAIGLDEIVELKRLALDVEGISDLPPEEQVKKLKSKLESQCEMINKLRENIDDLEKTIKKLKRKHASQVKTKNQKFPSFVESEKGPIDNNTEGAPSLTSIFSKEQKKSESSIYNNTEEVPSLTSIFSKEQKKSVKAEQKKSVKAEQKKTKKTKMQRKADGVSGSLEHPWPEWVQFLECLNERGYLSKAVNFPGGPLDLRGLSTEELYAFIKFAAVNFANDHPEIPKLLSGKDIRNVVLFGCPSVEIKVVLAAKRLRSFFSIKEDTAGVPINQQNTSNAPSVKVSKEKSLELVDLVRLLCAFGLNAEKNEVSVPDEIKQSVVNLLKELIDFSSTRCE